jgi:DNA polymerase/3'-5' exonuclease PolX
MLVKELIRLFKENWIDISSLRGLDRKSEVTREMLANAGVPADILLKYDSLPLWNVRGIGPAKATELWAAGARPDNLEKFKTLLPEATLLALKYHPLDRIPHDLVEVIASVFIPKGEKGKCTIVGSYRRKKPTSGDVDILYLNDKPGALETFLKKCEQTHKDKWILFAKGPSKIAGIFRFKPNVAVEIDLWIATPENYHAMLLYSTGSKNFNVRMRFIAKHRKMKLNQYGLWDENGKLVETKSERDIFEILKMRWRRPEERD